MRKKVFFLIALLVLITIANSCKFKKQAEYIAQLENALKSDSLKHVAEIEALKAEMQAKIDSIQVSCKSSNTQGNYCIITGSFKVHQNAINYIKEMSQLGYNAQIVESPNGFYLVSILCVNSLQEAFPTLNNARSNIHPDSWIYVK